MTSTTSSFPSSSLTTKLARFLRGHPVLQSELLLILAVVISIVSGLAAVALERSIEFLFHLLHLHLASLVGHWRIAVTIGAPAVGGVIVGLLLHYIVPAARGDSIPQVKLDLTLHAGKIPLKVAIGKFVSTVIAIGSGGSIGHEGPTVQICAGLGSWMAQKFPIPTAHIRTMVQAASAAGLAAAFKTPIAAVIFVMEEIIGDLNVRRLSYLIFAAVGASIVARSFMGSQPLFQVPEYTFRYPAELSLYVLLGAIAGLLSVAFIRLLAWGIERFQRLRLPVFIKPMLGGISVGLIAVGLPQVLGIGYDSVSDALQNRFPWTLMLLLSIGKFFATILSYSSGSAGGLLAPSLFIGSTLGGGIAGLLNTLPGITVQTPGALALVGMSAVFAGIMRTPLTSILLIFEMTDDYAIILPLMLATMTSFVLANFLDPRNVYEAILAVNRVHLPSPQDFSLLEELTVEDAMKTQHTVIVAPETPVQEVAALFDRSPYPGFPILTADRKLLGIVTPTDVRRALAKGQHNEPVINIATTKNLIFVHPDHTLKWVLQQLGEYELSFLPVLTRGNPTRFIGIITMSDVVRALAHSKTHH